MWRWCYRGCWHQSCPPLILLDFYSRQKPMQSIGTQNSLITLSCIVKFSHLLYSVESGPLSQVLLGATSLKAPTDLWLGGPLPHQQPIRCRLILWRNLWKKTHSSCNLLSGVSLSFPRLSQTKGQITDVSRNCLPVLRRAPGLA